MGHWVTMKVGLSMAGAIALLPWLPEMSGRTGDQSVAVGTLVSWASETNAIAETPEPLVVPRGAETSPQPLNVPEAFDDPADQIAPPGLTVEPGDAPISPYLAITMEQELESLMGRFESALILAEAVDQPAQVEARNPPPLLSATSDPSQLATLSYDQLHPALRQARQLQREWPDLITRQAYGEARQRWLTARQALWENFPSDRPFAQPEIRAMWLDRGTLVEAGSRQALAALFDRLAAAGINTIFLETLNASYPIYPSRVAPLQNPLTRHWDPMAAAVELAHERDMELHAWIWVFAAGNQLHNKILNLPLDYPGPVLNANPDWAGYDNAGNRIPRGQTKPFFDPANPEVRAYLLRLIEEIITTYDVDGLQLDYIRYPFQDPGANRTYGYGEKARQRFQTMTGVDPLSLSPRIDFLKPAAVRERERNLWDRWTEFRVQQVTSFVAEASQLVRRERPDMVLSTAVFAKSEHDRLQKIQQDWGTWAEQGLVDWIVLMSYAQDTNRFEQLIEPWIVENDYSPTLVIPGIRLLNLSQAATIDQLQALRDMPAPGYALFATANLNDRFQKVLSSTQGIDAQPIPQVSPFATAATRYRALQREWRWLMTQEQLYVEPSLLDYWVNEVNETGAALDAIAQNPSPAAIAAARSRLNTLREGLGSGMDLQTANTQYRLQAWRHRLLTIDRFLAYGEARLGRLSRR